MSLRSKTGLLVWDTAPPLEVPESLQGRVSTSGADSEDEHLHPVARIFREPLSETSEQHLARVATQLLHAVGVHGAGQWVPIVTRLATAAAACLSPPALAAAGTIDPRFYIKVKRLADFGSREDSCVVQGVTCRKNLTHRKMRKQISAPRILMLGSNFEFHRTQGRLASFDHYTKDQETEHLRSAVERLADMAPDVLLVEKSVARDAQDALLDSNISLALNVKRTVLDRLARCTGVQVASSLSQLTQACVAVCEEFEVEEYPSVSCHSLMGNREGTSPVQAAAAESSMATRSVSQQLPGDIPGKPIETAAPTSEFARVKLGQMSRSLPPEPMPLPSGRGLDSRALSTRGSAEAAAGRVHAGPRTLMYFKGCPRHLGCTIILKGASVEELAGVKKVVQFASYCAYRGRLETALLASELASAAAASESAQASIPASPSVGSPEKAGSAAALTDPGDEQAADTADPDEEPTKPGGQTEGASPVASPGPFEGCSEEEIRRQVEDIVGDSARGRCCDLTSASPYCSEDPQPVCAHSEPPSPTSHPIPAPEELAEPPPEASPQLPPPAEPSDPLSVAARELMLLRQQSQESVTVSGTDPEEDADLEERAAAGRLLHSQRLFVSVAKRNPGKGLVCEPFKVHRIAYYREADMPLAAFLAGAAAALAKRCAGPECGEGHACHTTSYLHARGLISVTVAQLPEGKELPGGDQGHIWFWARPSEAGRALAPGARSVLLSPEAASISLGHFLELGLGLAGCAIRGRRLHREFLRYFGVGGCVACFQFEAVAPNSVLMPPHQITYSLPVQQHWLEEEVEELIEEANGTFTSINEALSRLDVGESLDDGGGTSQLLRNELGSEGEVLSKAILDVCASVRTDTHQTAQAGPESAVTASLEELVEAVWSINGIRRSLAHMSAAWSARLQHPAAAAANLGMSRASSYEELSSSAPGSGGGHTRNISLDLSGLASVEEKASGLKDFARTLAAGHFLAGQPGGTSPGPPSQQGEEPQEAPVAEEAQPKEQAESAKQRDKQAERAEEPAEENLPEGSLVENAEAQGGEASPQEEATEPQAYGAMSPVRQALVAGSRVSERVAAFESGPLLRTISRPGWALRPRQRSATDTVLSWLNAGRRNRTAASGTDDAGGGNADVEQHGSDEEDDHSETGSGTSPASGSSPNPRTGPASASMSQHSPGQHDLASSRPPTQPKAWQTETPACTPAEQQSAATSPTKMAGEALVTAANEGDVPDDKPVGSPKLRWQPGTKPVAAEDESASPSRKQQLMREDSQLTSHFDVNYWDSMLKGQGQRSASVPVDLTKAAAAAPRDPIPNVPAKALVNPAAVPLSVPPVLPGKPLTPPSEAISSLNLQLTSALTAILTARKPEPSAASTAPSIGQLQGRSLLPQGVNERTIVVRDDEPTSLVAYFLSTRDHQAYLDEAVTHLLFGAPKPSGGLLQRTSRGNHSGGELSAIDALTARPLGSEPSGGSAKVAGGEDQNSAACAQNGRQRQRDGEGEKWDPAADWRVLVASDPLHFTGGLQDETKQPPGRARLQVTAWYSPQFAELRRRCCEGGEAAYVCSLSRCRAWEARGGKTRAYFAKTADARYIVKQLQPQEKKSFQEIAPAYFRYLASCMRRGAPTCLAKIMGVYTVSVRPANGKESVMDILVMENIFYDRELSPIYDLKGSERARLARDDPSDPTRVLLDQNLKQSNLNDPILVEQGVHAELERALWNDTAFLSSLGVMDYSLLVGVDKASNTLVVGIIDFIRQYTWDKALERWVKSGMGLSKDLKAPTIQSPKEYCRRFRVAMASYFTRVPCEAEPPTPLDPDSNLEVLTWKGASLP